MNNKAMKLENKKFLFSLLITTSEQISQADSISDLFIFLLRYSFLLNNASKTQNSRVQKTSQLNVPQGNIYMGARYLDPKYSRWISVDPALGEYASGSDAGCGGIYNHVNLNLYHYAGNNPIKYTDSSGRTDELPEYDIKAPTSEQLSKFNSAKESALTNLKTLSETLANTTVEDLGNTIKIAAENWLGITLNSNDKISELKTKVDELIKGVKEIKGFKMDYGTKHADECGYVKRNYMDDKIIYGGGRFDELQDTGNDVFSGFIIHEISHRYLDTKDNVIEGVGKAYGLSRCFGLAREIKITNADNWEYFYENIYTGGKENDE